MARTAEDTQHILIPPATGDIDRVRRQSRRDYGSERRAVENTS